MSRFKMEIDSDKIINKSTISEFRKNNQTHNTLSCISSAKGAWLYFNTGWTLYEPHCEKTGLRGFRPGPTQTKLYSYTRWLET